MHINHLLLLKPSKSYKWWGGVGWWGGGVVAPVILVSPQSQLDLDFDLGLL